MRFTRAIPIPLIALYKGFFALEREFSMRELPRHRNLFSAFFPSIQCGEIRHAHYYEI
jgi:hypothetical protein